MQLQRQYNVLLIGDSCTDEWVYGSCDRVSPEGPIPVLKYTEKQSALGMAANVNENLKSLGITVNFLTNKETITKTRYVHEKSNQQIMRLDTEPEIKPLREAELRMAAMHCDYDAVVISDYDKGYVDYNLFDILAPKNPNIKIFVDTKKKKLPTQYNNIVYKINKKEFELLDPDHIPRGENMIVTHGANGALWNKKQFTVPITRVFDVTGAGDTWGELTLANLVSTVGLLDDKYHAGASWIMSRQFYASVVLRVIAAAGGNTIDSIGIGDGNQRQLLGYPIHFSDQCPIATAVDIDTAYFGNWLDGVVFGNRQGIEIATSDHVDFATDQINIRATSRYDIQVHDGSAFVALATAAS